MSVDPERNTALALHPHYQHRRDPQAHDDRSHRDEFQDEVYRSAYDYLLGFDGAFDFKDQLTARELSTAEAARVLDFGCGSGFKLLKYFYANDTLGYEIEPTLSYLRQQYPQRQWADGSTPVPPADFDCDVLICADVIEHLLQPRALLAQLAGSNAQRIFLSTPALEVLAERKQSLRLGPPANPAHVQEWTTVEFAVLVAEYLTVISHTVFCGQGTQLIVAQPRD